MALPEPPPPAYDAVVLAGGRSSRLGGVPKAELVLGENSLLEITLDAAAGAGEIAVAGPDRLESMLLRHGDNCVRVREDPPFAGPAAAVGAALTVLDQRSAARGRPAPEWILVLACDMPGVARAVPALLAEAARDPRTSLMAVDARGKAQPLAALYRSAELRRCVAARPEGLENLSMFSLLARVQWREVAVPAGSTADVDTWDDAGRWGISPGNRTA